MKNLLIHLFRGTLFTVRLLIAWVRLSWGDQGRLTTIRFDETQIAQLWQKLRDAGGPAQVVFRADSPESWPPLSRNRAGLFLHQITQLRQGIDFRRQILQRQELFRLETAAGQSVLLYRIAWILWWEQIASPALQLVGWPLSAGGAPATHCLVAPTDYEVAIVGWYGTETLGDAAILGEILSCLREQGVVDHKIAVYGSYPARTRITLDELGWTQVGSQPLSSLLQCGGGVVEPALLVFGGGPLCDGRPLLEIAQILAQGVRPGRRIWLWGVGLGPVVKLAYRRAIARMLRVADRIVFRDEISRQMACVLEPALKIENVAVFPDPALGYLWRSKSLFPLVQQQVPAGQQKYCLVAGRALPRLAGQELNSADFSALRDRYDRQLRQVLCEIAARGCNVRIIPHEYWPEDDRDYFSGLIAGLPHRERIELIEVTLTVGEALQWYRQADMILAVRFHAAIFAVALNKPFVAVDYIWGNGKTSAFLAQINMVQQGFGLAEFVSVLPETVVDRLLESQPDWSPINAILAEEVKNHARFCFGKD